MYSITFLFNNRLNQQNITKHAWQMLVHVTQEETVIAFVQL